MQPFDTNSYKRVFFAAVGLTVSYVIASFTYPAFVGGVLDSTPAKWLLVLFSFGFYCSAAAFIMSIYWTTHVRNKIQKAQRAVVGVTLICAGGAAVSLPKLESVRFSEAGMPSSLDFQAATSNYLSAVLLVIGFITLVILILINFAVDVSERDNGLLFQGSNQP
jgi:cytochrome bd-type quinol oxidase subunit 2